MQTIGTDSRLGNGRKERRKGSGEPNTEHRGLPNRTYGGGAEGELATVGKRSAGWVPTIAHWLSVEEADPQRVVSYLHGTWSYSGVIASVEARGEASGIFPGSVSVACRQGIRTDANQVPPCD